MTAKKSELRPWEPETEHAAARAFAAPRKRRVRWGYVLTAAGWPLLVLAAAASERYAAVLVFLLGAAGVVCVVAGGVAFAGTRAAYIYLFGFFGAPLFVIGTVGEALSQDAITQKCRVAEVTPVREYPTEAYPDWRYRVECPSGPREIVETTDTAEEPEGPSHVPGETVGVSWRPGDQQARFHYGASFIPHPIGMVFLAALSLSAWLFGEYRRPPKRTSLPDESKPRPPRRHVERPLPSPAWGWPAVVLGCGAAVSGAAAYVFAGIPQPLTTAVVYLGFAVGAAGCAYFVARRRIQVLGYCALAAMVGVALGARLMEVLPQARLAADGERAVCQVVDKRRIDGPVPFTVYGNYFVCPDVGFVDVSGDNTGRYGPGDRAVVRLDREWHAPPYLAEDATWRPAAGRFGAALGLMIVGPAVAWWFRRKDSQPRRDAEDQTA